MPAKKFEYKRDVNATPLDKDIVELLKHNALKYTHTKAKRRSSKLKEGE